MCKMTRNICELLKGKKNISLQGSESAKSAYSLMHDEDVDIIGVSCDQDFVGVFSKKDFLKNVIRRNLSAQFTTLYEVMVINPPSVPKSYTFKETYEAMLSYQWNYMPIVTDRKLHGIVTMDELGHDLIQAYHDVQEENKLILNYIKGGEAYGTGDYSRH